MSTESVEDRRERLRASKQALLAQLAECTDRLESLRSVRPKPKPTLYWDSPDSDLDMEEPPREQAGRLREEVRALKTRLLATQELCKLAVEESAVTPLLAPPDLVEPALSAAVGEAGGRAGRWREVSLRCRVDAVPVEISFLVHENGVGALAYRKFEVSALKRRQATELAASALAACRLPGDAVDCLRRYSAACRVRRDTLQALADKYSDALDVQPAEVGYRVSCGDLLKLEWRLQNASSPLLPFRHRITIELEYITDDNYLVIIEQVHHHLKDPEISPSERTRLLCKLIDVCLKMYKDHNEMTGATEFDAQTVKAITNNTRRLTLDHQPNDIEEEQAFRDKRAKEKNDGFPKKSRELVKTTKKSDMNEQRTHKQGEQYRENIKGDKMALMEILEEGIVQVGTKNIKDKSNKQIVQKENWNKNNEGSKEVVTQIVREKPIKNKKNGKELEEGNKLENIKKLKVKQKEAISNEIDSQKNKKTISIDNKVDKVQNSKLKENFKNTASEKEIRINEEPIKENNFKKPTENGAEKIVKKQLKSKFKDKENLLIHSREIITGISKHANKNKDKERILNKNTEDEMLPKKSNVDLLDTESCSTSKKNIVVEKISLKTSNKNNVPADNIQNEIYNKKDKQDNATEYNIVLEDKLVSKSSKNAPSNKLLKKKSLNKIEHDKGSTVDPSVILSRQHIPQEMKLIKMKVAREKVKSSLPNKKLNKDAPENTKTNKQNDKQMGTGKKKSMKKFSEDKDGQVNPQTPVQNIFGMDQPISPIEKLPSKEKTNSIELYGKPFAIGGLKRPTNGEDRGFSPKKLKVNSEKPKIAHNKPGITKPGITNAKIPQPTANRPRTTSAIPKLCLELHKTEQTIEKRTVESTQKKILTKIPKKVRTVKSFSFGIGNNTTRKSPRCT